MEEIWKDIPGFEGMYQVSNTGKVKSLERIDSHNHIVKERILKSTINSNGYEKVVLSVSCKRYDKWIHSLVAQTFIGIRPKGYDVNHKDGNKRNNYLENLEYVTRQQNIQHSWDNGLQVVTERKRQASRENGRNKGKINLLNYTLSRCKRKPIIA